jgi:hypothetical protein
MAGAIGLSSYRRRQRSPRIERLCNLQQIRLASDDVHPRRTPRNARIGPVGERESGASWSTNIRILARSSRSLQRAERGGCDNRVFLEYVEHDE